MGFETVYELAVQSALMILPILWRDVLVMPILC